MPKLEIGSGNRPLDGYDHLDINADCPHLEYVCEMDDIPVEDNKYDEVNAVHVIEHQPWKNTLATLTEWMRVLKPGGYIRIACPNLRFICQSYVDARSGKDDHGFQDDAGKMNGDERKMISVDDSVDVAFWANFKIMSSGGTFDQHFACFDATMLTDLLKRAGATKVIIDHDGDSLVLRAIK